MLMFRAWPWTSFLRSSGLAALASPPKSFAPASLMKLNRPMSSLLVRAHDPSWVHSPSRDYIWRHSLFPGPSRGLYYRAGRFGSKGWRRSKSDSCSRRRAMETGNVGQRWGERGQSLGGVQRGPGPSAGGREALSTGGGFFGCGGGGTGRGGGGAGGRAAGGRAL